MVTADISNILDAFLLAIIGKCCLAAEIQSFLERMMVQDMLQFSPSIPLKVLLQAVICKLFLYSMNLSSLKLSSMIFGSCQTLPHTQQLGGMLLPQHLHSRRLLVPAAISHKSCRLPEFC